MKLLLTGLTGTLAPHVARAAERAGHRVIGWDHRALPPADTARARAWFDAEQPDAVLHLALGPIEWARELAGLAAARAIPFVFTSSAMVFDHQPDGPHAPGDARTARDDYGRYKIACEDAVRAACPGATVARLGWQIHDSGGGNHMLAHLDRQHRAEGRVGASRRWRPACSFVGDTAQALLALAQQPRAGVVHLDSHAAQPAPVSFARIVRALADAYRRDWQIAEDDAYVHDQRLVSESGGQALLPPLSDRLPGL